MSSVYSQESAESSTPSSMSRSHSESRLNSPPLSSPPQAPKPSRYNTVPPIHLSLPTLEPRHALPEPPHTPTGLRAQLNHLLPRHAYFRAKIQIHQLSSVPFVSGEFAVKWKFKNVHSVGKGPGSLLGSLKSKVMDVGKGKEREEDDAESLDSAEIEGRPSYLTASRATTSRSISGSSATSTSTTTSSSTPSAAPAYSSHLTAHSSPMLLTHERNTASPAPLFTPQTPTTPTTTAPPPPHDLPQTPTPSKGHTPYLPLKDHSITFSHSLDTVLQLSIDHKPPYLLHPSPLKLVVMQRVDPDDPPANANPRLGAVYLNLAEYVGEGSVERRYLLRECRVNATLKLTVELTPLFLSPSPLSSTTPSSTTITQLPTYTSPPLPKSEILTTLSGFLDKHTSESDQVLLRERPGVYGPYRDQEELELDLLGGTRSALLRGAEEGEEDMWDREEYGHHERDDEEEGDDAGGGSGLLRPHLHPQHTTIAFDVHRLPVAYGAKTTETLIEAIFNPVKTTERRNESPFTYYVPPASSSRGSSRGGRGEDWERTVRQRPGEVNSSAASVKTTVTSTTTTSSSSSSSGSGSSGRGSVPSRTGSVNSHNTAPPLHTSVRDTASSRRPATSLGFSSSRSLSKSSVGGLRSSSANTPTPTPAHHHYEGGMDERIDGPGGVKGWWKSMLGPLRPAGGSGTSVGVSEGR